jgi:hypothetical protein
MSIEWIPRITFPTTGPASRKAPVTGRARDSGAATRYLQAGTGVNRL